MLLVMREEPYVKRRLIQGYGKVVKVPEPEGGILDPAFIKEKEARKIDYDNAAMVNQLERLFETGKIKRVNLDDSCDKQQKSQTTPKVLSKREKRLSKILSKIK